MSIPFVHDAVNRVLNGKKPRKFTIVPGTSRSISVFAPTPKNLMRDLKKLSPKQKVTKTGRPYKIWRTRTVTGPSGAKYTISSTLQK
jgi:hypothetical protein